VELLARISEHSIRLLSAMIFRLPDSTDVRPRAKLALHLIGITAMMDMGCHIRSFELDRCEPYAAKN
jgi:hypothetical protein